MKKTTGHTAKSFSEIAPQVWPCVLKHFSQTDDFQSKYPEHSHFYHNFNRKIVAKLSSQASL
jgi:hypothetical protein